MNMTYLYMIYRYLLTKVIFTCCQRVVAKTEVIFNSYQRVSSIEWYKGPHIWLNDLQQMEQ